MRGNNGMGFQFQGNFSFAPSANFRAELPRFERNGEEQQEEIFAETSSALADIQREYQESRERIAANAESFESQMMYPLEARALRTPSLVYTFAVAPNLQDEQQLFHVQQGALAQFAKKAVNIGLTLVGFGEADALELPSEEKQDFTRQHQELNNLQQDSARLLQVRQQLQSEKNSQGRREDE